MVRSRCRTPEHSKAVGQRKRRGELDDQNEFDSFACSVFRRTLRNRQIPSRTRCRCVDDYH